MTKNYKISVIIPFEDDFPTLNTILNEVRENLRAYDSELIIVEVMANKETQAVLEEFDDLTIVRYTTPLNMGEAYNRGLEVATGDLILTMRYGTLLPPKTVERLIMALDENGLDAIGTAAFPAIAQPNFYPTQDIKGFTGADEVKAQAEKLYSIENKPSLRDTLFIGDFCGLYRRSVFEELGLFPEDYDMHILHDADFSFTMRKAGKCFKIVENVFVFNYNYGKGTVLGYPSPATFEKHPRM